jgi:Protein of unknown function (DUF2924)
MASLDEEIDRMESLSTFELRTLWRRHWKKPPPMRLSKDLMIRGLAYRLQEAVLGGIGKVEQRKLAVLAKDEANAVREENSPPVANGSDLSGTGETHQLQRRGKSMPAASPTPVLREGNRLVREWNGTTHTVLVLASGFEWQAKQYRSLSQIAEAITGAHWSGPRFFGLTKRTGRGSGRMGVDLGLPSSSSGEVSIKVSLQDGAGPPR